MLWTKLIEEEAKKEIQKKYKSIEPVFIESIKDDISEYVPYGTGNLTNNTRVEKNKLVYDTPYAEQLYYDTNRQFNKDVHDKATAQWADKAQEEMEPIWEKRLLRLLLQ